MNDNLVEYVMWPTVIILNVAAYYYDYYMYQYVADESDQDQEQY